MEDLIRIGSGHRALDGKGSPGRVSKVELINCLVRVASMLCLLLLFVPFLQSLQPLNTLALPVLEPLVVVMRTRHACAFTMLVTPNTFGAHLGTAIELSILVDLPVVSRHGVSKCDPLVSLRNFTSPFKLLFKFCQSTLA